MPVPPSKARGEGQTSTNLVVAKGKSVDAAERKNPRLSYWGEHPIPSRTLPADACSSMNTPTLKIAAFPPPISR